MSRQRLGKILGEAIGIDGYKLPLWMWCLKMNKNSSMEKKEETGF